jgi:acyl CoA:acetate/3-ketoacid CoA transferase beta subunit
MTSTAPDITTAAGYTMGELMVATAAREIRDGEVVFVGMRLPLIAFVVAKRTHAPNAVGLFENGVIRSTPARELIYTMADPPNIQGATQCLDMLAVMSLLQSGRVHLGFLGAAEVDRFGNLNSTQVLAAGNSSTSNSLCGDGASPRLGGSETRLASDQLPSAHTGFAAGHGQSPANPKQQTGQQAGYVSGHGFSRADATAKNRAALAAAQKIIRLPGSGGACDIASLAKRFVVLLEHSKRRLPERVSYITSPGCGDGRGWRQRVGLPRGGPSAAITSKAVLRFGDDGEAYIASVHPGVTVDDVVANTGWKLRVGKDVGETSSPTVAELKAIRDYDTKGFWTS